MFLRYYAKLWCLCILSCYVKSTCVLQKRQLESRQRQLEKRAVVKVKAYILSIDKKETVYKLEACEIAFFANRALAVHSTCSRILLTCLWVQAYSVFIVAQLGFIIQYDTVQAPCNTMVQ